MREPGKLVDISCGLFGAPVFPGDPVPEKQPVSQIAQGVSYNLTRVSLGSHGGTHMDAPCHFLPQGASIDQVELFRCVGPCQVVRADGRLGVPWVKSLGELAGKRLLVQGEVELSLEAAEELARQGLYLLGVEGMTVGPLSDPGPVHRALLGAQVALLESCDLSGVEPGRYFLAAQPLKWEGLDGAPVRAVLLQEEEEKEGSL